jgi:hypothetical protein
MNLDATQESDRITVTLDGQAFGVFRFEADRAKPIVWPLIGPVPPEHPMRPRTQCNPSCTEARRGAMRPPAEPIVATAPIAAARTRPSQWPSAEPIADNAKADYIAQRAIRHRKFSQ